MVQKRYDLEPQMSRRIHGNIMNKALRVACVPPGDFKMDVRIVSKPVP
jgi:hypothetical protein